MENQSTDEQQNVSTIDYYAEMLGAVASLSGLFSESPVPYLDYRATENIYCHVFGAENLSRSDSSADAVKGTRGIGIKTFLNGNGRTLQKIAEFNRDASLFRQKTEPKEIVNVVSLLRNERLKATKRIYGLDELIYHCVVREEGLIKIFECPMDEVDVDSIRGITANRGNTIYFRDKYNEYSFNLSKSTLYKRFYTRNVLLELPVTIIKDPFELALSLSALQKSKDALVRKVGRQYPTIYLPLFSDRGTRHVPERSGLNQWNAKGRPRDLDEVYIPIPSWIHTSFPGFFPARDVDFELRLPDRNVLKVKVCQDGGKALMSNPNKALGLWLLRQVLDLNPGELLTYQRLEEIGVDSVVVWKEEEGKYGIEFAEIGSYDKFMEEKR